MRQTLIFGAGRQGNIVHKILIAQGFYNIKGFLDEDMSKHDLLINDLPVLGSIEWLDDNLCENLSAIVAIGDNNARITIGNRIRSCGIELINVIHPYAVIMDEVLIGTGNLICAGSILVCGTCLEDDIVVNTGAIIDHDSILHSGAYISPGVKTAGCVTIGKDCFMIDNPARLWYGSFD
jgi:acetyltransferase EpsM